MESTLILPRERTGLAVEQVEATPRLLCGYQHLSLPSGSAAVMSCGEMLGLGQSWQKRQKGIEGYVLPVGMSTPLSF